MSLELLVEFGDEHDLTRNFPVEFTLCLLTAWCGIFKLGDKSG